ncbi:MAG: hypothetical protein ABEH59_04415 [Halobacteriales archaeon]
MTLQPSRWLASAGFLLLVPGAIWLAYVGRDYGLYPRLVIPFVFGLIIAVGAAALFAVLPVLKKWERRRKER